MPTRICFPFVGSLVGGSHISSAALIRHLDPEKYDPIVVVQHERGAVAELLRSENIRFEVAPKTAELEHGRPVPPAVALSLLSAVPRLVRFLRSKNVQIVHCNDGRTLATWGFPAKLAAAKLLWHHRGSPNAAGLRLVAPALADRVVAVSHFAAPRPGWYSAAPRAHVIHSPFDTNMVHDRAGARSALLDLLPTASSTARVVAYAGAMIDRKRPLLFVEAIAAMRQKSPGSEIHGVLFGESLDGMAERVKNLAVLMGVQDIIHIVGYRTPGSFWLAGCDLLMIPAVDEPFGRTLIEAMLVSTPVVATASGGNIEAIRDGATGLLVTPERPEALADACLSLLADPARSAKIATTARADARYRFGEEKHAEAVMAVYESMVPRGTKPRARMHFEKSARAVGNER